MFGAFATVIDIASESQRVGAKRPPLVESWFYVWRLFGLFCVRLVLSVADSPRTCRPSFQVLEATSTKVTIYTYTLEEKGKVMHERVEYEKSK